MNSVLSSVAGLRILFSGALVALFLSGCTKHEDDCSAPESDGTEADTRAFEATLGEEWSKDDKPTGSTFRGADAVEGDIDGDGISDDGDDEADGEGNKKNRPQH